MFAREDKLFTLIIKNLSGDDFPNVMKGNFKPGKIKLETKINDFQGTDNTNNNMDNNSIAKSEFAKPHDESQKHRKSEKKSDGKDFLCDDHCNGDDQNANSKEDD